MNNGLFLESLAALKHEEYLKEADAERLVEKRPKVVNTKIEMRFFQKALQYMGLL